MQELMKKLNAPLDESHVAIRPGRGGITLQYIPSHEIIRTANRIFGYGGWETEMPVPPIKTGNGYMCVMTVLIHLPNRTVKFTDAGYCEGDDDTAVKGSVSDALRRCLRYFGPQFGLDLYIEKPEPQPQKSEKSARSANGEEAVEITEIIDTRGEYPYPYLVKFLDMENNERELPCFLTTIDMSLIGAVVKLTIGTSAKGNKYIKKIEPLR